MHIHHRKIISSILVMTLLIGPAASVQALSATSFTADFSAMAKLKELAAQGSDKIGALLPETTTSARYISFDAPI